MVVVIVNEGVLVWMEFFLVVGVFVECGFVKMFEIVCIFWKMVWYLVDD